MRAPVAGSDATSATIEVREAGGLRNCADPMTAVDEIRREVSNDWVAFSVASDGSNERQTGGNLRLPRRRRLR